MIAIRHNILLKSSTGSRKPMLVGTLAFFSALALGFSNLTFAEDADMSESDYGVSREQIQTFINFSELKISDNAWRNNTSTISQDGTNNRSIVNQTRNTAAFAFGNYANIYQKGNYNEANIIQTGVNNIGLVNQEGDNHQATIKQHGNSFEARVNQAGYRSNVNISQSGSGSRTISVDQNSASGMAAPVTVRTN